jgi:hypothetical protein
LKAALLAALAVVLGCAAAKPKPGAPPRSPFGAADPRRGNTPLLGREAPNTTLLAMDAGIAGDRVSGLLEVPANVCAIVIARAGASIDDLDLLAYGEDGTVVGTDEAPDKTPGLLICPPHPPRVWVSARIAAGHGLVAIGAQRVAPAEAERTAALYSVKSARSAPGQRLGAWPGIEERIEAHRNDLGGAWQDVRRVAVPLDARVPTRLSAQVDAGRCLDAFVLPSDEVGHVELEALDTSGAIVGRAEASGRERYLVVCSTVDSPIAFEIRPQSGRGLGVLLLSRTRPGSEQDIDTVVTRLEAFPTAELERGVRQADSALAKSGYPPPQRLGTGTLETGRRLTLPVNLPAGCSRLDVIGGAPLRGLEAWVWSASGALVSHAKSGGHAVLFACGRAGQVRLDLESTLRSGPFSVLLRGEPDTHTALANHPLAAGRLLSHVVERGVLRRASEIGQVTEVLLSATEISTLDLTVPFGRCVDVTLALGADSLGAEIRLVAQATGSQVALARGPHATSARVCSLEAATAQDNLKTRAEMRVQVGSGRGLVATRLLSPAR